VITTGDAAALRLRRFRLLASGIVGRARGNPHGHGSRDAEGDDRRQAARHHLPRMGHAPAALPTGLMHGR